MPTHKNVSTKKSKLIYSHSLAQKIVHFQTLPIINITITDINCEMYADAESKTLELCLDQIRVQKVHFQIRGSRIRFPVHGPWSMARWSYRKAEL